MQAYNVAQGLHVDGEPIINPIFERKTTFMYTGDPITGVGYVDANPGDHYMVMSSGPFRMAPGDSQEVIFAKIVGQGLSPRQSIETVKAAAGYAKMLYANDFQMPQAPPAQTPPPTDFRLGKPYPNPFAVKVYMDVDIPREVQASLDIFDARGRRVRTLFNGPAQAAVHQFRWDGVDALGRPAASGVYFIRFTAPGVFGVRKVLLLR